MITHIDHELAAVLHRACGPIHPDQPIHELLDSLPTLYQGQADDCKIRTSDGAEVWLSRCGLEDGEPFAHTVTLITYCDPYQVQFDGDRTIHDLEAS